MLWWLAQNTLMAAVLAGIVAAVCRFARPSPAVRHALWLVVLVKLIVPPLVYWPWSTSEIWRPISQFLVADGSDNSRSLQENPPTQAEVSSPPENSSDIPFVLIPVMPEEQAQVELDGPAPNVADAPPKIVEFEPTPAIKEELPAEESTGVPSLRSNSMESLVSQVWLVGALAMAVWQVTRIGQFRRRLVEGQAAPEELTQQLEELSSRLHVRPPEIIVIPGIASPLIWALGRARLVWPESTLDHLPESSRESVLLHELAHLRRRDHCVGWLQFVGACLCWWNPLFWYVSRQVRENAELACDVWVVSMLPGGRRAYAEALIEVAQMISQLEAPAPALTLGADRRHNFERRLVMIMRTGIPNKISWRGLVVVGLLAVAAIPGWSSGQQEAPATPPPTAPAVAPAPTPALPPGVQPGQPTAPALAPVPPQPISGAPVTVPPAAEPLAPALATLVIPQSPPPAGAGIAYDVGSPLPQAGDPEARLQAIEQQLQALLKEVKGMRAGGANQPATRAVPARRGRELAPPVPNAPGQVAPVQPGGHAIRAIIPQENPGGEITLTRATYELPGDKAKALSDLLQGYKGPEVTMKIEGDKVTVTTSPEAQHVIGQFIRFLQGKPATPHSYYYQPVTTYQAVPVTAPATR